MPFEKIIAKVQTIVADVLEIDSDDIDPQWLSAIPDLPNEGPVRDLVKQRAAAALRASAGC